MPRRPVRARHRKDRVELTEELKALLLYGTEPERDTPAWEIYVSRFFSDGLIGRAWQEHEAVLLAEWQAGGNQGKPWAVQELEGNARADARFNK